MRSLVLSIVFCVFSLPAICQGVPPSTDSNTNSGPRPADLGRSAFASVPVGLIISGPEDAVCTMQYEGALRYSVLHKALLLCDGKKWNAVKIEPLTTP